jgi:hypothetical protein
MSAELQMHRPTRCVFDVLVLLALFGLALKMTYDISIVRYISRRDETEYMLAASRVPERGLIPAEYSPLYCLWYQGLMGVEPNRVLAYYRSCQVLAFLVPVRIAVRKHLLAESPKPVARQDHSSGGKSCSFSPNASGGCTD